MNSKLLFCVLGCFLSLLVSCGKDAANPADSGKTGKASLSVTGRVIQVYGSGLGGFEVTLSGNGITRTARSDSLGEYAFTDVPEGSYTVKAARADYVVEPSERAVTLTAADRRIAPFVSQLSRKIKETESVVCGWVLTEAGAPLTGYSAVLSEQAGAENPSTMLSVTSDGYFHWTALRGKPARVTATCNGFTYEFSPKTAEFTPDRPITLCTVTAIPVSPVLHTISGRLLDTKGNPAKTLAVLTRYDIHVSFSAQTDPSGTYRFRVPDGKYTILFGGTWRFEADSLQVTVKGADVTLADVSGVYTGATWYTLAGRVVDSAGNGIPGVEIQHDWVGDVPVTGADGRFETQRICIGSQLVPDTVTIVIRPGKPGYAFSPDRTAVTLTRKEGVEDGGTVTIPDFTGKAGAGKRMTAR
jgi:hypothetical protein